MTKNIFKSIRDYFQRKVNKIKEEYKSKINKPHRHFNYTQEEYDRFKKESEENDKCAS